MRRLTMCRLTVSIQFWESVVHRMQHVMPVYAIKGIGKIQLHNHVVWLV